MKHFKLSFLVEVWIMMDLWLFNQNPNAVVMLIDGNTMRNCKKQNDIHIFRLEIIFLMWMEKGCCCNSMKCGYLRIFRYQWSLFDMTLCTKNILTFDCATMVATMMMIFQIVSYQRTFLLYKHSCLSQKLFIWAFDILFIYYSKFRMEVFSTVIHAEFLKNLENSGKLKMKILEFVGKWFICQNVYPSNVRYVYALAAANAFLAAYEISVL